ncbi:hypothetical protein K461DRAFT_272244 [Myriangium duriaei CBS 260.36]|uniref:Uncharacterized protein n=1 Tax=Myriangium duriaei CBS 260.36 TaxID=1168546 RepID=A0A9P4IQY7_9PEZI|nr:hypothetical protein K461DRAFT_272244 [Myriangium duriaei CBS 260.36]
MFNTKAILLGALLLTSNVMAAKIQYQARYKVGKNVKFENKPGTIPDAKVDTILKGVDGWSGHKYRAVKSSGGYAVQVFNTNSAVSYGSTKGLIQEMETIVSKHVR